MPDAFGFETPQEAQARVQQRFLEASQRVSSLGSNAPPGQRVGSALSNIFGRPVQKFLDTRAARKDREQELINDFGIDPDAAKRQAREDVEPQFAEVRRAKSLESAGGESQDLMFQLAQQGVPAERVQAAGMLHMAQRLRKLGMQNEATMLSLQASELLTQAEERLADLADVKAGTAKTLAALGQVGVSPFQEQLNNREQLMAKAAVAETPEERESLDRQIGALNAKIAKDVAITGTSEFDLMRIGQDPTFARQQMTEIVDAEILNDQLDLARLAYEDLSAFEASAVARWGAKGIGFMENTFGIEPTDDMKSFINDVVKAQGGATFAAAQIRHALTGAQMSHFEIGFLDPFLPKIGDSKTQILAKIEAVRAFAQQGINVRKALLSDPEALKQFFGTQITLARRRPSTQGIVINTPQGKVTIGKPVIVNE